MKLKKRPTRESNRDLTMEAKKDLLWRQKNKFARVSV
jgi:hypothetical protein